MKVAVKVVSKRQIDDVFKRNKEDFAEIELMDEVSDCSNILTIIESFQDAEHVYIVSRYMSCGSLFDYIIKQEDSRIDEKRAQDIIHQIATGLRNLHKRNIVHRDIKVDNILVNISARGQPKFYVADLGSGVKLDSDEETCTFMIGTRGYVAPEILRGNAYGKSVDIFSLGCLMHAILSA